jgi:hypothetical protein
MEKILSINDFSQDKGKFIQVKSSEKTYLWSGKSHLLHGQILKNLLDSERIPYETFEEKFLDCGNEISFIKIPKLFNENYEIIGAGKFSRENGTVRFYGKSESYRVGPNKKHLEEISKLTGLELVVER